MSFARVAVLPIRWLCALSCVALLGACSQDVTGPAPKLADADKPHTPPPVDPGIICSAQRPSAVKLHGDGFSPVPIDVPGHPKTALPTVSLLLSHALTGNKLTQVDTITFSGNPDADPTNAYQDGGTPLLSWASRQEMSIVVNPSVSLSKGKTGMVPPGVYDVQVTNANGSAVTSLGSLAVVDKPELMATAPSIVCLDEADQSVAITGKTFVQIGKSAPVLQIAGVSTDRRMTLGSCEDIAQKGLTAKQCKSATITLPKGSVAEGYPELTVLNPKTADPTDPTKWFLYAFGGRNETGTYLASYEYATVTMAGDRSQTVSSWQKVDGATAINGKTPTQLSAARAELGAFVMTSANSSVPSGDVWIYVHVGRKSSGFENTLEAGKLDPDGHLGTLTKLSAGNTPANFAGYGYGQASNTLFSFGGKGGVPTSGGNSASLSGFDVVADVVHWSVEALARHAIGRVAQDVDDGAVLVDEHVGAAVVAAGGLRVVSRHQLQLRAWNRRRQRLRAHGERVGCTREHQRARADRS